MKKMTLAVALFFLVCSSSLAIGQTKSDDLSQSAKQFLDEWLVARDTKATLTFVSRKPILGSCMSPGNSMITGSEALGIIKKIFATTLSKTEQVGETSGIATSSGTPNISDRYADEISHQNKPLFRIFSFKPFKDISDNGFVCSTDENKVFLKAISNRDVYYLYTNVKVKETYQPFTLITVWKREGKEWKILTMSTPPVGS